ncbi:flagellar basal body-associated FliL family protein [Pelotalea chapellei]|uniref:Flagellar protein FliL n=1 Tax=Pelotalea chapellei TaxID=44671 RepID=A0ABS5U8E0_9BACT|nr:flagellar basal body-associated FliL family protein [Pelotalea chapellei]MBT1071942.1 flagellar basal body-associated FliL family protein [Pelotalea chapellei]
MAKEDQAPEVEGEGGKKKMFIIIGAGVAVAVILGLVVFMMMGKGDKKEKEGEGTKTEAKAEGHGAAEAPKDGGHGGGKEGAANAAANMFALEPFIVNIYDGQELRYLKVKVEIEMASPAVKADLDARLAPIRDTILVLLSTKTLQDIQDVQGKNQLKDEILASINKIIPPGKIAKVYFTDFVVQ